VTPSLLDLRFIVLLAVAALLRRFIPNRWLLAYGALVSVALMGLASPQTLLLLGGVALFVLYPLAKLIRRFKNGPAGAQTARLFMGAGVTLIVVLWIVFKANRSFGLPFMRHSMVSQQLVVVFGFSYFLFKAINFLYIHYLADIPESNPLRILYYVLFPSTITSGPIQKYTDFCQEMVQARQVDSAATAQGIYRITKGYFFKICVAVGLKWATDSLLAVGQPNAYQALALLVSLYTFLYFDFAGYSHIAIGFGLLMGVKVPENFRQPFLATSMTEFWRHWHVTIGDWFRDHVFIPQGGMRLGGIRAALLAGAIMFACGLWHGLTVMFVAWGVWHGTNMLLEGVLGVRPMPPARRHGPRYWGRVFWTNLRVAMGALFFLPTVDSIKPVLWGLLRWY
jgi:alginate O-acetyltransferase complex protein AlgI